MEKSLAKLNKKLAKETDDVYDYVDERAESVEKTVKKHEKALEYVLHLPSTLLVPSRSSLPSKSSSTSTPSSSSPLKYHHSGATSPVATKLETIHEGKEIFSLKPSISAPATKTVVVKSPPPSPSTAKPPLLLRPFFVMLSLMTLPALIFVHAAYTATFPLRWSFRMLLRLAGVEQITFRR